MAKVFQGEDGGDPVRRADRTREALIAAAKALISERPPSSVPGRVLAEAAGVNYGLIHHYFGSKDAVFRAAIFEMRDEFLARHPSPEMLGLLTSESDPYLRALVRSQMDYPRDIGGPVTVGPIAGALVSALKERLTGRDGPGADRALEARARAIALISLQLGYGVFKAMLLDAAGVGLEDVDEVEAVLRRIYEDLALLPGAGAAAEEPGL